MAGLTARPYLIEEYTRTVCPACFAERRRRSDEPGTFVDGMLVSHSGSVWMRRYCPSHGETESLYEEDVDIWRQRRGWSTQTLAVVADRADNFGPFPAGYRHGLPASHGQHTCILVLNLTQRCNFACPTCYATAQAPGTAVPDLERPTADEVLATVRTMLARENGKLGVVMLSGGEPTLRRDLEEIIDRLCAENVTRVMLNTNGRRLAKDAALVRFLRERREKVEVYLQCDSLQSEANRGLRGQDLVAEKREILELLDEAGLFTTLVMTVDQAYNRDEVGAILQLGLSLGHCSGMAIQPAFGSGRLPAYDARARVTPTGVMRRLAEQTGGLVAWDDFIPLPCSHRDCCDITYLLKGPRGWQSLPKLTGRDELKNWLHLIANTITFEELRLPVRELLESGALVRIFSEQQRAGAVDLARDLARMCDCIPGLSHVMDALWAKVKKRRNPMESLAERTFRITVKMFMDVHTFHEARLRQCCVHTGTFEEDPRRYSFCWRWLFEDAADLG